jgi:hypothetical protein
VEEGEIEDTVERGDVEMTDGLVEPAWDQVVAADSMLSPALYTCFWKCSLSQLLFVMTDEVVLNAEMDRVSCKANLPHDNS